MEMIKDNVGNTHKDASSAVECDFPMIEISEVAEQESWRKEINRPVYHIHKWWATRLGSVFRAITLGALSPPGKSVWDDFYEKHNFSGKVVLDPFMGSGTTLGEAVKLGAKAVGCDINPVSSFLVRQAFTPVSDSKLKAAFSSLEERVASEIKYYYRTVDPQTGDFIPVLYYFWVKTVFTPTGEEIPLFSRYVFSQNAYPKKKPKAQIVCPKCWGVAEGRYDETEFVCWSCGNEFNPQKGPASGQFVTSEDGKRYRIKDLLPEDGAPPKHRMYGVLALRPDGSKVYLPARDQDLALYNEAGARLEEECLPLPDSAVREGHNTNQARSYNYKYWQDFFNSRQLLCLGMLLREILNIEDRLIQEQMLCLFSGVLEFNNLFCSFKGEGTGAVRHMFSNHILKPERTPLENSVWGNKKSSGTFSTLFESRLLRAKKYLEEPFEVAIKRDLLGKRLGSSKIIASSPIEAKIVESWEELDLAEKGLLVLNGDSSNLPIPGKSIDAVITDPPYFDFVHYSELSDFFFAWLSPVLKDRYEWFSRADSSGEGEVQHKDPLVFSRQLAYVFSEASRVLKDTGVLAFSFHHSRPEGWAAIYESINNAGLAVVTAHPVHAELRGASPKTAAKDPISLDAILVCRKKEFAIVDKMEIKDVCRAVDTLAGEFAKAGMTVSNGDRFVIGAAETMIARATDDLTFDQMKEVLTSVYSAVRV